MSGGTFDSDGVANHFRARSFNRLVRAGILLRQLHRTDLNIHYPPASVPGQFPRRRTGRLLGGVLVRVNSTAGEVEVASTTPYTLPLTRSGRRTVWHTFLARRASIARAAGVS